MLYTGHRLANCILDECILAIEMPDLCRIQRGISSIQNEIADVSKSLSNTTSTVSIEIKVTL